MEEIIKIAAPVLQAVSVAITACFAVQGLRAWRKQLIGKRRFEVAEEAILAAYRVGERLEWVRNGAVFEGEVNERPGREHEIEQEARQRDTYWVPLKRIADAGEDFAALNKARLLCKVHFGDGAAAAIEEILKVRGEVIAAAQMLVNSVGEAGEYRDKKIHNKLLVRIWAGYGVVCDEKDELTLRIKKALENLDEICTPHLK